MFGCIIARSLREAKACNMVSFYVVLKGMVYKYTRYMKILKFLLLDFGLLVGSFVGSLFLLNIVLFPLFPEPDNLGEVGLFGMVGIALGLIFSVFVYIPLSFRVYSPNNEIYNKKTKFDNYIAVAVCFYFIQIIGVVLALMVSNGMMSDFPYGALIDADLGAFVYVLYFAPVFLSFIVVNFFKYLALKKLIWNQLEESEESSLYRGAFNVFKVLVAVPLGGGLVLFLLYILYLILHSFYGLS